jgi:hypothetical protein
MRRSVVACAALVVLTVGSVLVGITPAEATALRHDGTSVTISKNSAITSMWAWGNSVAPSDDSRGLGEAAMEPGSVASFASAHRLTTVYLAAPWASNQGAIGAWLNDTVNALHAKGIKVAALGGDAAWIDQPGLAAEWVTDARAAAHFDSIQLDVEPWAGRASPDFEAITTGYLALLKVVRPAAGPLGVGADLPWWLGTKRYGAGTSFDALVRSVDTVAIVTFVDHSAGADGIVAVSAPAVASAVAAGKPFTIGVETDLPEIAGGAKYTFADQGATVLESETAKVRTSLSAKSGYRGVTVEHLLAWESLIAATPASHRASAPAVMDARTFPIETEVLIDRKR